MVGGIAVPISLESLFLESGKEKDLKFNFDMSDVCVNTAKPFVSDVAVELKLKSFESFVLFSAKVSYDFSYPCDRCAEVFDTHYECEFEHKVVNELNDEDKEYILADNFNISPEDIIKEDILLSLPSKILCKSDCKGLCPQCGTNLNNSKCDCKSTYIDPRLEVLKQLL